MAEKSAQRDNSVEGVLPEKQIERRTFFAKRQSSAVSSTTIGSSPLRVRTESSLASRS